MGVSFGSFVLWSTGGHCCIFRPWSPWPPRPSPPPSFSGSVSLPAVFVVSASPGLVVCLLPGGALCRPPRGALSSGLSVAAWPLWFAFSGWALSSGWGGCPLGVLAVGPAGVARSLAWLGGGAPWWSGCVASRVCGCVSCLPPPPLVGGFVLVGQRGPCGLVGQFPVRRAVGFPPLPVVFFWGGASPLPPSALPRPMHALVGERRGQLAR